MKKILLGLLVIGSFSGCLKGNDNGTTFTCSYNACAYVAPASEIQAVKDYLAAQNITTAIQHCSGVFYTIDDPGTGASPTVCNTIAFTYVGKLTNGTQFDASTSPVVLGLSQLIAGFKNTLPLIKAGGRMHLYVPPSLGYGANPPVGSGIPANAILVFDVSLLGVQ